MRRARLIVNGLKRFATVSLSAFLFLLAFAGVASAANISYYGSSSDVKTDGVTKVEVVLTFPNSTEKISMEVIGRITNFNANSNDGPVDCKLTIRGISEISCLMNPRDNIKTAVLQYDTSDFVKTLGNRFFYSVDITTEHSIDRLIYVVRLPEGTALVEEAGSKPGRLTFPQNSTTSSDGRRIIVTWELKELAPNTPLKFEVFYESLTVPFWAELRIRYFLAFGVAAGLVVAFLILRRAKKSEQLVLSVLDDFEKKVVDLIIANQGVANQRKIVQETNLSKAKVSRIVKSLVERGIVEVERLGRTNKLKLIKKKFKF